MLRRPPVNFSAAAAPQQFISKKPWRNPESILQRLEASKNPITYSQLKNGVRVAVDHRPGCEFATSGVWIDAGSRFESRENNGTAHFLEHMTFKGSRKYTKKDIDTLFEHSGSHFNAYTARDRTSYYL